MTSSSPRAGQANESESDTWSHPFHWQWAGRAQAAKPREEQDKQGDVPPPPALGRSLSAQSERHQNNDDDAFNQIYLRLDVVNIADDDVDNPLSD